MITNTKDGIDFLGSHIIRPDSLRTNPATKAGRGGRICKILRMRIQAPIEKIISRLIKNNVAKRNSQGKVLATARMDLVNHSHYEILSYYNSLVHGYLNFYSFASNYPSLLERQICWLLLQSCALTLALKFKLLDPGLIDPRRKEKYSQNSVSILRIKNPAYTLNFLIRSKPHIHSRSEKFLRT